MITTSCRMHFRKVILSIVASHYLCGSVRAGLDDGLLAHYRLDGNATDSSSAALHGINEGGTTTTDRNGNPNSALHFGGTAQVRVPSAETLNFVPGNSYSVSMWIRRDGGPDTQHIIGKRGVGPFWQIAWAGDGAELRSSELPLGQWTHVAVVWKCTADTTVNDVYVNGEMTLGNRVYAGVVGPNTADLMLGRSGSFGGLVGALDEIRIYNRAISFQEIRQLYRSEDQPMMTVSVSEVRICWNSTANATYRVDYRSELTTNIWTALTNCVLSGGMQTCIYDRVDLGKPQRFYRVAETNCVPGQ